MYYNCLYDFPEHDTYEICDDMETRRFMDKSKKNSIIYYMNDYERKKIKIRNLEKEIEFIKKNLIEKTNAHDELINANEILNKKLKMTCDKLEKMTEKYDFMKKSIYDFQNHIIKHIDDNEEENKDDEESFHCKNNKKRKLE